MIASKHDVNANDITMLEFNAEVVDGDNHRICRVKTIYSAK